MAPSAPGRSNWEARGVTLVLGLISSWLSATDAAACLRGLRMSLALGGETPCEASIMLSAEGPLSELGETSCLVWSAIAAPALALRPAVLVPELPAPCDECSWREAKSASRAVEDRMDDCVAENE